MIRMFACIATFALLAACAGGPKPAQDITAPFNLTEDLGGKTVAKGVFSPIFGSERRFTAYLNGYMDGEIFVLEEDFDYEDGEKDRKVWRLTPAGPGEWSGVRGDVIGTARAYQDGSLFRMDYQVKLGGRQVRFQDILYRTDPQTVINQAKVSWHGLPVGKVRLNISR